MLEQCCKHSKQCHNSVATLCWAKNRHCESSHVTLPIVIYLILLFIPLARCGRIGNSFTRTSCGKSNYVTCGKSTLNSVNLLCLRVIGDKSQFFTDIFMVYKCLKCFTTLLGHGLWSFRSLSKAKENHERFCFFALIGSLPSSFRFEWNVFFKFKFYEFYSTFSVLKDNII